MQVQVDYHTYLNSEAWRLMRTAKLFLDGVYDDGGFVKCELCEGWFAPNGIEIHHLTYARLGHERLADLRILDNVCHAKVHNIDVNPIEVYEALAAAFGAPYETRVQRLRRRFEVMATELVTLCGRVPGNRKGEVPRVGHADVEITLRHFWEIRELMVTEEIKKRILSMALNRVYDAYEVPEEKRRPCSAARP